MPVIAAEDAREVLEPHIPALIESWSAAWSKWLRIGEAVPDGQVAIRARAQANVLYDLMVYELKHRFSNVPGVTLSETGGFLTLNFSDVILLRFKKLDRYLRSHNIMTRQQKLFSLQLVLPGFPVATRVVLGYQLDKLRMGLENFLITCHTGERMEWMLPLMEPGAEGGAPVIPIPVEPDMPKPRIGKKRKQDEGDAKQDKRETGAQ